MNIHQIKVDFKVTEAIARYVYVYLIETESYCYLIDSGVAGSERIIEDVVKSTGHNPDKIHGIFLTHAHPDHIGTAKYFKDKYGTVIYASEGERPWIEDINLQFKQRPIPNFYQLAGQSVDIDVVVKDGDHITLDDDLCIDVVGTPGHSKDEVSYRIKDSLFIGDVVPVKGDIPIYINLENTKASLKLLADTKGITTYYPAWDVVYDYDQMQAKLKEAQELIEKIGASIVRARECNDCVNLVEFVCTDLHMPMLKMNPLFQRTIESYL